MNTGESFSREESIRYARHLTLPEVGPEGQAKLKSASCLLVGAGGLGSPAAMYLAAAGVGRLGLVDFDVVDASNLQRQIIHGTTDLGKPKIESAMDTLAEINPFVQVEPHETALTSENAIEIANHYDVIIDGTDNFATRYLVNDVCVLLKKPNCYGSIFRFEGQASVFAQANGPCYRCLYPQPPEPGTVPSCAEGGVLGVLPGIIGTIQATEAIKLILGIGVPLTNRLLLFDALEMAFRELKVRRDPNCPVCGDDPSIQAPIDYHEFCGVRGETVSSAQNPSSDPLNWEPAQLKHWIDSGRAGTLLDVRESFEYDICNLGGTLIPLAELEKRRHELDSETLTIVHCKSGGRSAQAAEKLRSWGFANVVNLKGGILAWADQIDDSITKY